MAGDTDMIEFLQRAFGYTLTGLTVEQVLFFLYGSGANGKSIFLETLAAIVGDYGAAVSTQTIMARHYTGIPNDVARLAGKRFAAVGEVEDGSRMSESLVKDLTGGDSITARFLRREFFDFRPQFKSWIRGNHKPQIRGSDEGIWRRIHLIPFAVRIPAETRDPHLLTTLRGELPGILAWAVKGCLEYHRHGLPVPAVVRQATSDYREEMDVLGEFLTERCTLGNAGSTPARELFKAYQARCEDTGNFNVTETRFGNGLRERGFEKKKSMTGAAYLGITLYR